MVFFFNEGSVFWPAKSKSDVYFCLPEPERICNPEKPFLPPDYRGFQNFYKKYTFGYAIIEILMYYYLLERRGWSWLIFPDQNEALGGAIAPITSSVGLKWSSEGAEINPSQPASMKPCTPYPIPDYWSFPVTVNKN